MQYATHAVIISRDLNWVSDWLDFCEEFSLKFIAILESFLEENEDKLEANFPILWGTIHGLKRGENVSKRLMVNKLAEVLLRLI